MFRPAGVGLPCPLGADYVAGVCPEPACRQRKKSHPLFETRLRRAAGNEIQIFSEDVG